MRYINLLLTLALTVVLRQHRRVTDGRTDGRNCYS